MLKFLQLEGCKLDGALYYIGARYGHGHILEWLHKQGVPRPDALPPSVEIDMGGLRLIRRPILMFLGDIKLPLPDVLEKRLSLARDAFCTFHGLLRWAASTISETNSNSDNSSMLSPAGGPGNDLLSRLSMLPNDAINKIAVKAKLQHDLQWRRF